MKKVQRFIFISGKMVAIKLHFYSKERELITNTKNLRTITIYFNRFLGKYPPLTAKAVLQ